MDKPKKRNTITIKINGKESPFQEKEIDSMEPENESKIQNQDQPNISDKVEQETAAARELVDDVESFEWILPETNKVQEIREYQPFSKPYKKNHKTKKPPLNGRFSYLKKINNMNITMLLAVFFAVLIGTFFGLLLLKIVPSEKVIEANPPIVEEMNPNPSTEIGTADITLESITLGVVQEGIYSSETGAEQSKAEMKAKGIPAEVFSVNGQFALFVGITDSLETAKPLGTEIQEKEIETYSKEFSIDKKTLSNLQVEEKKLLELFSSLYPIILTGISTNAISNEVVEVINNNSSDLESIDKEKLNNENIVRIYAGLKETAGEIKQFEKDPQPSTFDSIQQHLLTLLTNYQKL